MKVSIKGQRKDIRALWMEGDRVVFIDQRALPRRLEFYEARDFEEVAYCIKEMVVRGAPAIGAAGVYGMAQAALRKRDLEKVAGILRATRPTAHDLFFGIEYMMANLGRKNPVKLAEAYVDRIVEECMDIGKYGEKLIPGEANILTHCNAGALATVDYGTALAPIRFAHDAGKKIFVFVDETRPLLQGARLTAWEMAQECIDHRIIVDNAAGHFMSRGEVDLVIVGADRIAQNGDFANKIGTYEKAVLAKENGIPFYVAAPRSTFDFKTKSGRDIIIEERSEAEVLEFFSSGIAPESSSARNPAFDVTPAKYVTGFITPAGVLKAGEVRAAKNRLEERGS